MSSTLFHRLCLGAILLAYFVSAGAVRAKNAAPLSEADILKLIDLEIGDDVIVARIAKVGVSFTADDAAIERMKKGKASDAVLAAVKKAASARSAAKEKATTYDDVMQLLKLGIAEDKILARLKKSPTKFILGAGQVAALKKAGAGDALLAAMKAGPGDVSAGKLTDLAIILDCSGSMEEKTKEGTTKMEAARRAAADMVKKLPGHLRLAFIIYGHDAALKCEAIKVVRPLGELDDTARADLLEVIGGLRPAGHTPIAGALKVAGTELAKRADARLRHHPDHRRHRDLQGRPGRRGGEVDEETQPDLWRERGRVRAGQEGDRVGQGRRRERQGQVLPRRERRRPEPDDGRALTAEVAKEVEKPADTVEEGKTPKRTSRWRPQP